MSRRLVIGALALVAVSAVSPLVQAQTPATSADITIPNPGRPVRPGEPANLSVNVRYSWDSGIAREPTEVRLEVVEQPPWMDSTFHPSSFVVNNTTSSPTGNHVEIVTLTRTVFGNVSAYTEARATYRVVAEENGVLPAAEATDDLPVTAGFRGSISAELPKGSNVTAWGGVVTEIPIEITNNANGPLLVEPIVALSPADAKISTPDEVRVNATEGDQTTTAVLEVQVPWSVSLEGPVIVELTPTHAQRGTPARTIEVEFGLEGNSAVPVPGPNPAALLVLAGVAAVALARARRPT